MRRYLRVAASVGFAVVAVLLGVLWARSYYRGDLVRGRAYVVPFEAISVEGWLKLTVMDSHYGPSGVTIQSYPTDGRDAATMVTHIRRFANARGFGAQRAHDSTLLVPHWFPFVLAGACCAAPWLRWRFSLRTMLIAATLIAVFLGFAAYPGR